MHGSHGRCHTTVREHEGLACMGQMGAVILLSGCMEGLLAWAAKGPSHFLGALLIEARS